MLPVGHILNQRYRVERLLGHGGMASVYIVSHVNLEKKRFALKMIESTHANSGAILERFRREAAILSEFDHPHIVNVVDWDVYEGQHPYLVMELLDGTDLAHFIQSHSPVHPSMALPMFLQIAEALGAAHAKGIVHRDLKPANIFVCKNGPFTNYVKVLDFGIAKVLTQPGVHGQTKNAVLLGTPEYMAPEQAMGKNSEVDARTDQFALAAILYELLSGRPAFYEPGEALLLTLQRVVLHHPPPLADRGLNDVVMRALSKDPAHRFPTLRAFVEATGVEDMSGAFMVLRERGKRTQATRITEELPPPQSVVVLTDAKNEQHAAMAELPASAAAAALDPSIIPSSVVAAADPGSLVTVPTGNVVLAPVGGRVAAPDAPTPTVAPKSTANPTLPVSIESIILTEDAAVATNNHGASSPAADLPAARAPVSRDSQGELHPRPRRLRQFAQLSLVSISIIGLVALALLNMLRQRQPPGRSVTQYDRATAPPVQAAASIREAPHSTASPQDASPVQPSRPVEPAAARQYDAGAANATELRSSVADASAAMPPPIKGATEVPSSPTDGALDQPTGPSHGEAQPTDTNRPVPNAPTVRQPPPAVPLRGSIYVVVDHIGDPQQTAIRECFMSDRNGPLREGLAQQGAKVRIGLFGSFMIYIDDHARLKRYEEDEDLAKLVGCLRAIPPPLRRDPKEKPLEVEVRFLFGGR